MPHRKLLLSIAFVLLSWFSVWSQITSETVLWKEYSANYRVNDQFSVGGLIQYRPFVDRGSFHQMVYGINFSYRASPWLTYQVGSEALTLNRLQLDSSRLNQPIFQPFQSVQLVIPIEKIKFRWRFRLEERFFREISECQCVLSDGYLFAFRFRVLSEFFIPLAENWEVQTGVEAMIQAGDWVESNFDQRF